MIDGAVPLLAGAVIAVGIALRADASTRPLALTLGLAAGGALVLRRRAPTLTLAVSGALVLGLFAIDAAAGAIAVIAPGIALYSLALTRGRVHLAAAVVAAAAAVMVADVVFAGHAHAPTLQTAAHVALVAIPVLAAEALRNRRAPTCGFCSSGSSRPNAPARRRHSAAPSTSGCGSPATCTTLSRTRSPRSTSRPASPLTCSTAIPETPAPRSP